VVLFKDRPMFSDVIPKGLGESFPLMWLNIGPTLKNYYSEAFNQIIKQPATFLFIFNVLR